jgi:hypothetical protein
MLNRQWFESHPTLCHLCCKPFQNEPAVAYLACCVSATHLACASARLSAAGKCPVCWMTVHNKRAGVQFAYVPSVAFLHGVHRFFRERNYYHVFARLAPPEFLHATPGIDHTNAAGFSDWLVRNATRVCQTLLGAGHLNELLRTCAHPSEAVDLFYAALEEIDPAAHTFDPIVWRLALMDYTTRERRGPSPFSLVFRLIGGELGVEQLHGLAAEDLVRMGIFYPHLCQLGWSISQNGGALTFTRDDLKLLHFPDDANAAGAARGARAH